MRRILITGMSGAGKSSPLVELGERGFHVGVRGVAPAESLEGRDPWPRTGRCEHHRA